MEFDTKRAEQKLLCIQVFARWQRNTDLQISTHCNFIAIALVCFLVMLLLSLCHIQASSQRNSNENAFCPSKWLTPVARSNSFYINLPRKQSISFMTFNLHSWVTKVGKHFLQRATFKTLLLSEPRTYYVYINYNLQCTKIRVNDNLFTYVV